jgi:DNA modification methylase
VHGAPFPVSLVRFLMEFLTEVDDLVVDNFSGSQTTPEVAEILGRRWLAVDNIWEYLRGGAERMRKYNGFRMNPMFDQFKDYQERTAEADLREYVSSV